MPHFLQRLVPECLFAVAACLLAAQDLRAPDLAPKVDAGAPNKTREALWQALEKALPKKYREIDTYAENQLLSQVLFRSQGVTLVFSFKTGKVEEVQHMKVLGKINCITFHQGEVIGVYILWLNGRRELSIAADE